MTRDRSDSNIKREAASVWCALRESNVVVTLQESNLIIFPKLTVWSFIIVHKTQLTVIQKIYSK